MSFTTQELQPEIGRLAGALLRDGVSPGDRVALLAASDRPFVLAAYAIPRTGAVLVPLHTALDEQLLGSLVRLARVTLVLHDERHTSVAQRLGVPARRIEELTEDADSPLPQRPRPADVASILFTSGTTGTPRGAILTHDNFAASAAASAELMGTGPGDTWLTPLPLFHVGGLALLSRAARDGFRVETHSTFEPEAVAEALTSGRVTHASLVARTLERILEVARGRFHANVRAVLVGGGSTPEALLARAREHGLPVLRTYGLTEACSQVATQRIGEMGPSCGRPLPGTTVTIEQLEAGKPEGEILVHGPTVMRGYLGEPPLEGRALRTGDIGRLDSDGRLFVLDRRTDLVVSGGENVVPAEVEAVLAEHPAVAECCVIGSADGSWGQRVHAVVRARTRVDAPELERHCRERLAPFQVPRRWTFTDELLPRTASGKVRREEVRRTLRGGDASRSEP